MLFNVRPRAHFGRDMAIDSNAYRIGEDGKLYFKYNLGATYGLKPQSGKPFTLEILSCELDELTGLEYYRIKSAGAELPLPFSIQRLELMLSQYPTEQTEDGEPQEIPLLLEEVREFFDKRRKELNKANVAENAKLKGTAWNKNSQAIAGNKEMLWYYRSQGNAERIAEIEKRIAELEAEQSKILTDKGVDYKLLTKKSDCAQCSDTGVFKGRICECARDMASAIKLYCAAKRLAKRG